MARDYSRSLGVRVPRSRVAHKPSGRTAPPDDAFDCISRLYDPGAGSMVFDGRPLASFVRHLGSLGIAQDYFKRPAPI